MSIYQAQQQVPMLQNIPGEERISDVSRLHGVNRIVCYCVRKDIKEGIPKSCSLFRVFSHLESRRDERSFGIRWTACYTLNNLFLTGYCDPVTNNTCDWCVLLFSETYWGHDVVQKAQRLLFILLFYCILVDSVSVLCQKSMF